MFARRFNRRPDDRYGEWFSPGHAFAPAERRWMFQSGRRGRRRDRIGAGLFGPFSPFGPFGPLLWSRRARSGRMWKYLLAAAIARQAFRGVRAGVRAGTRYGGRRARQGRGGVSARRGWRGRHDAWEYDTWEGSRDGREGEMPRFGKGPERTHGRRFDRGDVKYVLLDLLREGPRHGYDMIKEMERRSGGFYSPSAGSVYPTLQMLEDQGLVTSTTVDGKRVYRLTDAGYAFMNERSERTDDARGRAWIDGDFRDELRSVGKEAGELARSLRDAVRQYTPDQRQVGEIRDVIGETRKRIEAILAERRDPPRDDDRNKPVNV